MGTGRNRGFLWEFLCQPGTVGAVAASSAFLAREMVEGFDWPRVRTVVEYGSGTGAFTSQILERLEPGARYVAIELNPRFMHQFQTRYPDVPVYQESAVRVASVCHSEGIAQIDAVVCGLPWASFPDDLQASILDATVAMLAPDGQFSTFAYLQGLLLPEAFRLRNHLRRRFASVTTSRIVWRNLPPAFIYRCRSPETAGPEEDVG